MLNFVNTEIRICIPQNTSLGSYCSDLPCIKLLRPILYKKQQKWRHRKKEANTEEMRERVAGGSNLGGKSSFDECVANTGLAK